MTWEEPFVTTSLSHQNLRSHPPGSFFPVGISTVTYYFTFPEIPGYSLNCSFFVNVMAGDFCFLLLFSPSFDIEDSIHQRLLLKD